MTLAHWLLMPHPIRVNDILIGSKLDNKSGQADLKRPGWVSPDEPASGEPFQSSLVLA